MKKDFKIRPYNGTKLELIWEDNFYVEVKKDENEILIKANTEGLVSLARHMLTLAQNGVPDGTHIHLDEFNSLEDESCDLIIEKTSFN